MIIVLLNTKIYIFINFKRTLYKYKQKEMKKLIKKNNIFEDNNQTKKNEEKR